MKNLLYCLTIVLFGTWISCAPQKAEGDQGAAAAANDTTTQVAPAEFADPKYADISKKAIAALASGNVESWLEHYSEKATYRWNNGDSLIGKPAMREYWTKRWTENLDSLSFNDAIYLPIKVNTPQSVETAGTWVLAWYRVVAKYKTGKSMTQWMHVDMHFDGSDKIDEVIQYRDNQPIIAANTK